MKNFTFKTTALAAVTAAMLSAAATAAPGTMRLDDRTPMARALRTPRPVRDFRGEKPWQTPGAELSARLNKARKMAPGVIEPSLSFADKQSFNYLEGPDGTVWSYIADYDYDYVDHGSYKESIMKSFKFTIYDDTYTEIGTIQDVVELAEGETRAAQVALDPAVSRKFFNSDNRPEVIVSFVMNTGPEYDYAVHYYNKVYSIGGQKEGDNDVALSRIEGRCIDAINVPADQWSENFFYTFVESVDPNPDEYDNYLDYIQNFKTRITIYKKAGWSSGPSAIYTRDIYNVRYPGDTMDGIYMISKNHNKVPYFIFSEYAKPYYVDPTGFATDESATADNSLIIDVLTLPDSYATELRPVSTTVIPVVQAENQEKLSYTYLSVGSLAWYDDIDMSVNGTPEAPAFIVARDYVVASDIDHVLSSYDIIKNDGSRLTTLAENTDGVVMLSDIPGQEPQAMFVNADGANYEFNFVDLYSGNLILTLPQSIDGQAMQAAGDRVATADGYKYVYILSYADTDEDGNYFPRVAWINTDGTLDHIDRINAGKSVARSSIYLTQTTMTPYLYDTDPGMEYTLLVGRYTGNSTQVKEEFMVVNAEDGSEIINFSESDGKGTPYLYSLIQGKDVMRAQMIYDNGNNGYNIDLYNLPFSMMAGGDGTAENPYLIATVGDLQMIKNKPGANYALANDFDAADFNFEPIAGFGGTLDGRGHTISNLTISSASYNTGIFSTTVAGAVIKDLTFVNPTLRLSQDISTAGLLGGNVQTATVSNVHAYNLKVAGDNFGGFFGGFFGQSTLHSAISDCSILNAEITLPGAEAAGGFIGSARTGSTVKASAFSGKITANAAVGGIVGESITGDEAIADCHVNAEIIGANTIGGIIGSSARSPINRCYVEGSILALSANRWSKAYAAGGIVGSLRGNFDPSNTDIVVADNVVALSSLGHAGDNVEELKEDWPGQTATIHRIIGQSMVNLEPEAIDYDNEGNPVYGNPRDTEKGIANNYALSSLPVYDRNIEATDGTTEGASVDAISREFLASTLKFAFGTVTDAPWHEDSDADPWLYHETLYILGATDMMAVEGETFTIDVCMMGNLAADEALSALTVECDRALVEATGSNSVAGNTITLEFRALKAGSTAVTVDIAGEKRTACVEIIEKQSGVENIVAATSAITFDGATVAAANSTIAIYSATGVKVAAGTDRVAVASLVKGVYVAVATDAAGNRSTLKIAVR